MDTVEQALKAAVERRHGGTACLAYVDAVSARVPGRPVWNGIVLAFDLDSQPKGERAYAWFSSGEESPGQVYVVLHGPPIRSAHDAVIAALAAGPSASEKVVSRAQICCEPA